MQPISSSAGRFSLMLYISICETACIKYLNEGVAIV